MKNPVVISIEDDPSLFQLIALTLRPLPIDLYNAPHGAEALRLVPEKGADLLLLDISLPDMHGWEVLKAIKDMDLNPKVIVLTTHTAATHRVIGRLQDVDAYISKPFQPKELQVLVAEVLGLA